MDLQDQNIIEYYWAIVKYLTENENKKEVKSMNVIKCHNIASGYGKG